MRPINLLIKLDKILDKNLGFYPSQFVTTRIFLNPFQIASNFSHQHFKCDNETNSLMNLYKFYYTLLLTSDEYLNLQLFQYLDILNTEIKRYNTSLYVKQRYYDFDDISLIKLKANINNCEFFLRERLHDLNDFNSSGNYLKTYIRQSLDRNQIITQNDFNQKIENFTHGLKTIIHDNIKNYIDNLIDQYQQTTKNVWPFDDQVKISLNITSDTITSHYHDVIDVININLSFDFIFKTTILCFYNRIGRSFIA